MEKMQAASLADLVRMADKLGLPGQSTSRPSVGPKEQPGDLASRK